MKKSLITRHDAACAPLAIAVAIGLATAGAATAQAKAFNAEVLQEKSVGTLEGDRKMRMVMFTIEPGGEVPEHMHNGPGLRYVLEGQVAIAWADGSEKVFGAGETYFEGPGANHPAGEISARNPGDEVTKILIIEALPE